MTSLYLRLFRYREREGRAPLENYLTEAVADIFNRLPGRLRTAFVTELLIGRPASGAWKKLSSGLNNISCRTQAFVRDDGGSMWLDLVFEENGKTLLVIENKIGAGVGSSLLRGSDEQHGKQASSNEQLLAKAARDSLETQNQLQRYGRWLSKQSMPDGWKGNLTLLTHLTQAPVDFLDEAAYGYGSVWKSVCNWGSVYRWLKSSAHTPDVVDDDDRRSWLDFAIELADFLEEEGMSDEELTSRDIAAAQLYVESHSRISNTFEHIYKTVRALVDPLRIQKRYDFIFNSDGRVLEQWIYLNADHAPKNADWYIAWGIRYWHSSKWWTDARPALPQVDHAFVVLGSEGLPLPPLDQLTKTKVWAKWSIAGAEDKEPELVIAQPLTAFLLKPDAFAEEFGHWLQDRILEIKTILPNLRASAAKKKTD